MNWTPDMGEPKSGNPRSRVLVVLLVILALLLLAIARYASDESTPKRNGSEFEHEFGRNRGLRR